MQNNYSSQLLLLSIFFFASCGLQKDYKPHKFKSFNNYLNAIIYEQKGKFDIFLKQAKDTTKTQVGHAKLIRVAELKNNSAFILGDLEGIISKIQKNRTKENIQNLMFQKNRRGYVNKLKRYFTKYQKEYREKNPQYLPDTTAWTRRYIQLLPETQRKNPPTFGEFYFKDASKEEVLLTLNMLRLAVLQEALEIQQKIIYEK